MPKKFLFGAMALMMVMIFAGASCGGPGGPGPEPGKATTGKTDKSGMEDVCKYFPKELVEEAIGRSIVRVEDTSIAEDHLCDYFTTWSETYDHTPYGDKPGGAMVVVVFEDDSSVTASKAEFDKYGYTYKKDDSLPVDNLMVYSRGAKTPYRVDLIVSENKFFRINTIHSAVTDEEIVKIGKRFAERMKNGK
jgi:hypothetical protein